MPGSPHDVDLAVVGGGVIGLSIAWRARLRGLSVTVLERDRLGAGASRVAAGMLAPVAETEFGEAGRRVLELGLRSVAMWPAFASELEQASGLPVPLHRSGTLLVARDADEARELDRQIALRDSLGLATRRLRPTEAREMEPALAPTVRLALEAPDDHSVEPQAVLRALRAACERAGVQLREGAEVEAVEIAQAAGAAETVGAAGVVDAAVGARGRPARVRGLRLAGGERVGAAAVVLAAGAWTGQLGGLPEGACPPVRPVKGQIMRLRDPAGPGLLTRVLRYEGGYLVPRGDGRYVLGATVEEQGFNPNPTAGGIHELLRHAWEVVPGIAELEIEEIAVSFRPGTPDNLPVIGPGALEGLLWATGHYRNGILLAPVTAELVSQELLEGAPT